MSVMPSMRFSFTRAAILSCRVPLFTPYGNSVKTSLLRPPFVDSTCTFARMVMMPRPVSYACLMPSEPMMRPPVWK